MRRKRTHWRSKAKPITEWKPLDPPVGMYGQSVSGYTLPDTRIYNKRRRPFDPVKLNNTGPGFDWRNWQRAQAGRLKFIRKCSEVLEKCKRLGWAMSRLADHMKDMAKHFPRVNISNGVVSWGDEVIGAVPKTDQLK